MQWQFFPKPFRPRESLSRMCFYALLILLSFFILVVIYLTLTVYQYQQFVFQVRAFLAGQLHLLGRPGESWVDVVPFLMTYYWPGMKQVGPRYTL